jgi:hypothetical protein
VIDNVVEFKWDDVKHDKFKENYIGHSIHAGISLGTVLLRTEHDALVGACLFAASVVARPTFNDPKPNALWYLDSKNPRLAMLQCGKPG